MRPYRERNQQHDVEAVHYGDGARLIEKRRVVLGQAYELHPERFVRGRPSPQQLPDAVWINPPEPGGDTD